MIRIFYTQQLELKQCNLEYLNFLKESEKMWENEEVTMTKSIKQKLPPKKKREF